MKKVFLLLINLSIVIGAYAQKETVDVAQRANPSLSLAQQATLEWVKVYDLTSEQSRSALAIQQAKFSNLASIESLKTKSPDVYVQKRLASFEIANSEFSDLLDKRQAAIFKQKEIERTAKYEGIVVVMKKAGYSDDVIRQKLMDTEF